MQEQKRQSWETARPAMDWSEILVDGILGSFADTLLITLGLAATIQMLPTKSLLTLVALSILGLIWHRSCLARYPAADLASLLALVLL